MARRVVRGMVQRRACPRLPAAIGFLANRRKGTAQTRIAELGVDLSKKSHSVVKLNSNATPHATGEHTGIFADLLPSYRVTIEACVAHISV